MNEHIDQSMYLLFHKKSFSRTERISEYCRLLRIDVNHHKSNLQTQEMVFNSSSLTLPPIFARKKYNLCTAKMRTYLKAQRLWDVVENGSIPPFYPINQPQLR